MFFKQSALIIFVTLFLGFKSDPAFLRIIGLVTVDGKPVKANVEINSVQKNISTGISTITEKSTGNFTTKLPSGDEYEIVVRVDHFPQQVISLSTFKLDSSQVMNIFADFISPEYDKKLNELNKSTKEFLNKGKNFDKINFRMHYGNHEEEQLEYKVQIGAYKFYENFNYTNLLGLPEIIRKVESDTITRFTMGSFATYNKALILLEKLQGSHIKNAFIVAAYKGERKILQQLIDEKILN